MAKRNATTQEPKASNRKAAKTTATPSAFSTPLVKSASPAPSLSPPLEASSTPSPSSTPPEHASQMQQQTGTVSCLPTGLPNVSQVDLGSDDANSGAPNSPSLLGMPAEVRNQIYRYTLVEVTDFEDDDSWIVLDQSTAMQPALLRCCRQIREEAFSIYWEENAFWLVINDLKLAPQTGHWIWQHSRTGHPEPRADSTKMVWGNLLEWLHLHWQGDERFQQVGWGDNRDYPPVCGRDVACLKAFELVEECRGMDWARTKRILDLYGEAVEGKSRWDWAWE